MQVPRILLAAPGSGAGKTTLTCGILQALVNRGCRIASFKCGPDYVDPMFHSKVIGSNAYNLDPFLMTEQTMESLLCTNSAHTQLAVIEGVMGYYDGLGGNTTAASTYSVAKATNTPTVLVVNGKGMSTSIAPVIKGFLDYTTDHTIQGVLLNQISAGIYPKLKAFIEEQLPVSVFGYLPVMENFVLESRPLGLVPVNELPNIEQQLHVLAAQIEASVDLDGLLGLGTNAPALSPVSPHIEAAKKTNHLPNVSIGIAKDEAFCFYYADNLKLLTALGAKFVPVSPLHDSTLPDHLDGLLLGGGYANRYVQQLSMNPSMCSSMHSALTKGLPCIAEGSGFSYLHQTMSDQHGTLHSMVGILPGQVKTADRLQHFGYFTLTANQDTLLLKKGEQLPIHEFHYQYSTQDGTACTAVKPNGSGNHPCIFSSSSLWAGFPHLHFYANPLTAVRFINTCRAYQANANKRNAPL